MDRQILHNYFPRSDITTRDWHKSSSNSNKPTSLDVYDSFDKLDHTITDHKDAVNNLQWLKKPSFETVVPKVLQKYRITADITGYNSSSIQTEVVNLTCGKKILVTACEEDKHKDGDYMLKHFRKTYDLPEHCEIEKLVSYIVQPSTLVIEVPLREKEFHLNTDLIPKINENEEGEETLNLDFNIPEDIDPTHVHITIKDQDFVLKAEDKTKKPDGMTKFHYFKQARLPHNTNFDELQCKVNVGQISCTAPLNKNFQHHKAYHGFQNKLWNRERPEFHARKYDFEVPTHHTNIPVPRF